MAQQLALPEEETARKAAAIKTLSLSLLVVTGAAGVISAVMGLFIQGYPVVFLTLTIVAGLFISAATYGLVRVGKIGFAGRLFVAGMVLIDSIIVYSLGGAAGPLAIIYTLPILVAALIVSLKAVFLAATVASILYLATFGIEVAGFIPQIIEGEWREIAQGSGQELVLAYIGLATRVIFFYLIAFLSWFVANRLVQALQNSRRYVMELQTANEKLQASEEELRAANEELRATEEELRASNEELQSTIGELEKAKTYSDGLLKSMVDGLGVLDLEGKVIDVNAPLLEMLSLKKEEIVGLPLLQSLGSIAEPMEIAKVSATIGQLMAGVPAGVMEMVITHKDGTQVTTSVTPSLVRDVKGKPIMLFAVMRDITERKRMEQEIQDRNEQLDAQNEELRATEEELRASNEELEAANEELRGAQEQLIRSGKLAAIGQLAGGVGHELRNPLGAIKNAVYYVRGKVAKSELAQKEPRVLEFINIMDEEISSSNKIISDLLGFSRVGKPAVLPTRIEKVIEDALSRATIPENIELTEKLDSDLNEVEIDPEQIQQVLVNMITNAVQAMPEGGKLAIRAKKEEKFLDVEITDTGAGIPRESVARIFEPLFTTRAKGIGLGLAVSKSIIDRHGGHVEVKSKVGKGTTFNIKLPLKAA